MRRYLETLFRAKEVFLIPVILVPAVALVVAIYTRKEFRVPAAIWVAPSAILDISVSSRATPAASEAQAITEWLATESFRAQVIDQSGLGVAIDAGKWPVPSRLGVLVKDVPVVRGVVRRTGVETPATPAEARSRALDMVEKTLSASAGGKNLVYVVYRGPEPVIGQRLVDEVLALYEEKSSERTTEQTRTAVDFYTRQLQIQLERMDLASEQIRDFLTRYPDPVVGQARPAAEEAELSRLQEARNLERSLYESTLRKLEQVRIAGEAAISDRDESLRVIDRPEIPEGATLTVKTLIMTLVGGVTIGTVLGAGPIVLMTWWDRRIRTVEDVKASIDAPVIGEVLLRSLQHREAARQMRRSIAAAFFKPDVG